MRVSIALSCTAVVAFRVSPVQADHIPTSPGTVHLAPGVQDGPWTGVPFRSDDARFGRYLGGVTEPALGYDAYYLGRPTYGDGFFFGGDFPGSEDPQYQIVGCHSPGALRPMEMAYTTCGKLDHTDAPDQGYWIQFEYVLRGADAGKWRYFVDDEFQEQFDHPGGDARFYAQWYTQDLWGEITDFAIQGGSLNHTRDDICWCIRITEGPANIAGVPMLPCTHPFGLFVEDDRLIITKAPEVPEPSTLVQLGGLLSILFGVTVVRCGWCKRRPSR